MPTIKFYTYGPSAPCRSVYMTCKALGLNLDVEDLDLHGKKLHLEEGFLKINPMHKVPTIVDGDFVLWESHAIMRYLVLKYGGENNSLYPKDLQKRAVIDRLMDHNMGVFYKSMLDNIFIPMLMKQEATKEQNEKLASSFEWLDTEVKDKKFLAGNDLTIADFAYVSGYIANVLYKEGVSKYPNAIAWCKRIQELPYFKEINQPFFDFVEIRRKI